MAPLVPLWLWASVVRVDGDCGISRFKFKLQPI